MSIDYAQMVQGCRHHKPAAQRALYDEFAPMVLGICRRYAASRDEADDLMQDSFVRVFEKIGTLRDTAKLQGWIYSTTVNICLMHLRKKNRLILGDDIDSYSREEVDLPYSEAEIVEAMDSVTPAQRLVFNLCCVEEMDFRQVAAKLNCSESNVRGLLSRARACMREYLIKSKK